MTTPHRNAWRRGVLALLMAAVSGCAARASYVYDEPVVYARPAPVYVAPPPPAVHYYYYHGHPVERRYYAPPRAYHAPPARVYRAPSDYHHHYHYEGSRHDGHRDHGHHH